MGQKLNKEKKTRSAETTPRNQDQAIEFEQPTPLSASMVTEQRPSLVRSLTGDSFVAETKVIRMLVLGAPNCGKASLMDTFVSRKTVLHTPQTKAKVEAAAQRSKILVLKDNDNQIHRVRLELAKVNIERRVDSRSKKRWLVQEQLKNGFDCALLVYSSDSQSSYDEMQAWARALKQCDPDKNIVTAVCATKADLLEERVVALHSVKTIRSVVRRAEIMAEATVKDNNRVVFKLFNGICLRAIARNCCRTEQVELRPSRCSLLNF